MITRPGMPLQRFREVFEVAQFLDQLRIWIQEIIAALGYLGVGLLMFIESVIPIIPSEAIMPFAGSLVAKNEFTFIWVVVSGVVGTTAGTSVIYYLGLRLGEERIRRWFHRHASFLISEEGLNRSLEWFERYGRIAIVLGRMVPGVRSLISFPAGMRRMKFSVFLPLTALGVLVWTLILITAGVLLGENWEYVLHLVAVYEVLVWSVLGILVGAWLIHRLWQRREDKDD